MDVERQWDIFQCLPHWTLLQPFGIDNHTDNILIEIVLYLNHQLIVNALLDVASGMDMAEQLTKLRDVPQPR